MKKLIFIYFISLLFFSTLNAKEIKLGLSADLSGEISYIGINIKKGIESYFNKINKTSTTDYKLIAYDDKYNPIKAAKNVKKLIKKDNVLALIGNVGTPTANVVIPLLEKEKKILFGAYSGGEILRNKALNKYVFNYRASYSQEAYSIMQKIYSLGIKPNEVAVFSQNDTYGDSGFKGVVKAYIEKGYSIYEIPHERYSKGTLNIEGGLSKLLDWNRDFKAIVIVGVNEATEKFISYAKEDFPNAIFFVLSPVNLIDISKKLVKYKKDIYTTQVTPLLTSDLKAVQEFKEEFKNSFPKSSANLISFEGYLIAKLFVKYLENEDLNSLNTNRLLEIFNTKDSVDIGLGFSSDFMNNQNQYSDKVWFSNVKDEKLVEATFK